MLSSCAKSAPETPAKTATETTKTVSPSAPQTPVSKPASFSLSSLNITPSETTTGSPATIVALVTNDGELSGTYEVILKVDGAVEATENVTLAGGASQNVTFGISKALAKTYIISIGELSGALVVKGPPAAPWVKVSMGYKTSRIRYPSMSYGFSVFHPVEWTVDTSNPAQVQFKTGSGTAQGLLSITSANVSYASLDELVNALLSSQERRWKERGATMTIISRGLITLTRYVTGNVTAADITMEIQPGGGKARHIYALVDGQAFIIVAETYIQFWDELGPIFDRVLSSFTVYKQ